MKDSSKPIDNNIQTEQLADIWTDPELSQLLLKSEENRESFTVDPRMAKPLEEEYEERPDSQDPEEAHRLYYHVLNPEMRRIFSPKVKKAVNPEAKRLIYEQKNLLLKDGRMRGRDGRQAYLSRLQQAIQIVRTWEHLCDTENIPAGETKIYRLYIMFKDAVDNLPPLD